MELSAVLLHNSKSYYFTLVQGKDISIGAGKKDDVNVPGFANGQIQIKYKGENVSVNAKKAYGFENPSVPLDELIMLDNTGNTVLYFSSISSQSDQTLTLPYNAILKFGRSPANDVVFRLPFVSGVHFVLKKEGANIRIEDNGSTNGLYLNGDRVNVARMVSGDVISILTLRIHLINGTLYFSNVGNWMTVKEIASPEEESHVNADELVLKYRRSPRTRDRLPHEDIVLAPPPAKGARSEKGKGFFASIASPAARVATTVVTSASSPALMAARTAKLVPSIARTVSADSKNKKRMQSMEDQQAQLFERYGAYMDDQRARIEAVAQQQREIISHENPDPAECMKILFSLRRNLWERMPSDEDFLDVRIGMGYEDLCVPIKSRSDIQGFTADDENVRLAAQIIEENRIVDNLPARLSLLKRSTIGVVGNRVKTVQIMKNLLVTLTSAHFYEDVKIVGIFDPSERAVWEPMRWFPHVWDDDRQFRTLAFDRQGAHELCEMFDDLIRKRKADIAGDSRAPRSKPHYIFIFGSKDMVEHEQIMSSLFDRDEKLGITSIFLFDDMYMLPPECRTIVDVNNDPSVYDRDEANKKFYFTPDEEFNGLVFDAYARRMSAIETQGMGGKTALPSSITFLRGYGVKSPEELNVLDRWSKAKPYKSLAAPIGLMAGDKVFGFDIHEKAHGPHGLVAGTTGSGKSELLQTWMLSMAVNYHPHDVSFVIIDYKGGVTAELLAPLPHVVGKITNINSNITRSLVSLRAEVKRRSAVLAQYGVTSIDAYQQLYKSGKASEPMPHLIIVSDEFAELKKEEPEFISQLVSVARVGRALGVHLVLATQKPGGIVDEQIQSNSRFRLCLKVQDVNDSREMIKRPDAARITQAGRSYIRVGEDEYFDIFQSFWSGAPYKGNSSEDGESENQVRLIDINGKRIKAVADEKTRYFSEINEITAIVRYISYTAKENGIESLQGPWLPELPEKLVLDSVCSDEKVGAELKIPVGIYDAPEEQRQGIQYLNFSEEGHYGIYGAQGTGKTTFLKTVLLSLGKHYTPEDVNIYVLDFGGWSMSSFADMPHVGGVALDREEEKFSKFEKLIMQEFEHRKKLFLKNAVGSLTAYRESVAHDIPAIVIAIDNITPLFDLYPQLENLFVTIARDGATYGIYLIYTAASTSGVRYKILQSIRGAVAFELVDKGDYSSTVGRLDGMSLPKVAGRAFFRGNPPVEFQAALYTDGEGERERTLALRQAVDEMNRGWQGKRPCPIPVMPERISADDMLTVYNDRTLIPVGYDYEDVSPAYIDLTDNYSMLIGGTLRCGKSGMLSDIYGNIIRRFTDTKLFVFDGLSCAQAGVRASAYKYAVSDDGASVNAMLTEIVGCLNVRKKAQNQARQEIGAAFDEKQFISAYELICIVIDDLKEFVDSVSNADKTTMERICRMAAGLGVIVLTAGRMADVARYNGIDSFTASVIANQNAIVLSGTPNNHTYLQNDLRFSERDNEAGEGNAYLYEKGKCRLIKLMQ